jgi:peptidoglycan/LPS O-acetylase OafA/YrhL
MLICIVLYFAFYGGLQDYSQIWISRQLPIFASTWSGTPLPPQWSLDVEMQFYVLFAFIAVISRLFYHNSRLSLSPWLPLAFVSICYSVWHLASGGSIEEPKLFVWLGFFCLGIAIYKTGWLPSKNLAIGLAISFILGTIIIILRIQTRSAFWISGREAALQELSGYAHFLHWPNLWLAVGVLFFLPFISLNVNQLSSPFDRELGNLAYPLYMFHWIPRTWYYNHANWERPILYNLTLLLINILTAFAGSWLIYILLDRPIDRFRSRWVSRRMSTKSKIS